MWQRARMAHAVWAYSAQGMVNSVYRARTRAWDCDTRLYLQSFVHPEWQNGVKTYRVHVGCDEHANLEGRITQGRKIAVKVEPELEKRTEEKKGKRAENLTGRDFFRIFSAINRAILRIARVVRAVIAR